MLRQGVVAIPKTTTVEGCRDDDAKMLAASGVTCKHMKGAGMCTMIYHKLAPDMCGSWTDENAGQVGAVRTAV